MVQVRTTHGKYMSRILLTESIFTSRELLRAKLWLAFSICQNIRQEQGMRPCYPGTNHRVLTIILKGGHFSITPTIPFSTKQNYLPSSNVRTISAWDSMTGSCVSPPPREIGVKIRPGVSHWSVTNHRDTATVSHPTGVMWKFWFSSAEIGYLLTVFRLSIQVLQTKYVSVHVL